MNSLAPAKRIVAITSHKGGSGTTTCSLALAWCFSQSGRKVFLLDAVPLRTHRLFRSNDPLVWRNVVWMENLSEAPASISSGEMVLIDCPVLIDGATQRVLEVADGVILCCRADPLTLRSFPGASAALALARSQNPKLQIIGISIGLYDRQDDLQVAILHQFRQYHGNLLLDPPIPLSSELRNWGILSGQPLPPGEITESFTSLAQTLERRFFYASSHRTR